jgi:hypothetical protein
MLPRFGRAIQTSFVSCSRHGAGQAKTRKFAVLRTLLALTILTLAALRGAAAQAAPTPGALHLPQRNW